MIDLVVAHTYSSNHHDSILKSKLCGCFYCLAVFTPININEWIDEGKTAICPYCGIDSVLCDTDISINKELLKEMKKKWFL